MYMEMDDIELMCADCPEDDPWECQCCPFNPINIDDPDYDPWDI